MKKYIRADLYRLFRRIPRLIMLVIVFAAFFDMFRPSQNPGTTIIELTDLLESALKYVPVYIGFIEILYIFGDDFTGKTAQIAIGTGVKRHQVILAKWLEIVIAVAIDVIIIVVLVLTLSFIKTHTLPAEIVTDVLVHALISILATASYMALIFPVMFFMQSITVSFLIYILLASGAVNKIISYVGNGQLVRWIRIENYTLTNCLNVFRSRLILGNFQFESVIGIILYLGISLFLTYIVYKNRELEF